MSDPRKRLLRLACAVALATWAVRVHEMWPVATPLYVIGAGAIGALLLALLVLLVFKPAPLLEALSWLQARPWGVPLALGTGLVVLPLSASPQLILIPSVYWPLLLGVAFLSGRVGWQIAWLAVVGLAAIMRVGFVLALPRPFWTPDSPLYLYGVENWVSSGGELVLGPIRTPTFPLLVLAVLTPTRSYLAFVVFQHLLGFGVSLWAALQIKHRLGDLPGWLTFVALGLSPHLILYEHTLMSETTYVLTVTVASVLALCFLDNEPAPGWTTALGLGLSAALAVLARPTGLPLVPLFAVAALLRRWRLGALVALAVGLAAPLGAWMLYNSQRHGVAGLTNFGGFSLFGVAGHRLDMDSPLHAALKSEMRPAIERHNRRRPTWNPDIDWIMYSSEGPLAGSRLLNALPAREQDRVIEELAKEAVRAHPWLFLQRSGYQVWRYALESTAFQPWLFDRVLSGDILRENSLPGVRAMADTPAMRAIERLPRRAIYDAAVKLPSDVLTSLPLHLFEHLGTLLVVGFLGLSGRHRLMILGLALFGLSQVVLVCTLNRPLGRYYLQALPTTVLGVAVVIGRRRIVKHPEGDGSPPGAGDGASDETHPPAPLALPLEPTGEPALGLRISSSPAAEDPAARGTSPPEVD